MPYIDGKRVSAEEWQAKYSSTSSLYTGPNGENPAEAPEIDAETKAPANKKKAGGNRSKRSERAAKNAVADALGVKPDSPVLADIDVTGLDAVAEAETPVSDNVPSGEGGSNDAQ